MHEKEWALPLPFQWKDAFTLIHVWTVAQRRFWSQSIQHRLGSLPSYQRPIFGIKSGTFDSSPTLWRTQWIEKGPRVPTERDKPSPDYLPPAHYLTLFPLLSPFFGQVQIDYLSCNLILDAILFCRSTPQPYHSQTVKLSRNADWLVSMSPNLFLSTLSLSSTALDDNIRK